MALDGDLLKSGLCPICGAGPFVSPVMHVSKAHGMDRFELREQCGLLRRERVCDPNYSENCSERARERYERGEITLSGPRGTRPITLSQKGRAIHSAKLKDVDRAKAGRTLSARLRGSDSPRLQAGRAEHKRRMEAERDEILRLLAHGRYVDEIALTLGVTPRSLRARMTRHGIKVGR